jgi:nitroreductase
MKEIFEHRSIRKYKSKEVSEDLVREILSAGIRASNTGNMQAYSIIVTRDNNIISKLSPLHFNQPMVEQAPLHITFCVDINRFHKWCKLRGAEPGYDNFLWFMNGSIDAILASQNVVLQAESRGLGICYLGTCLYNAKEIIDLLKLPKGVFPVAAIMIGYPDEQPALTDRLPLDAVVHYDKYNDYSDDRINELYADLEASDLTKNLLKINDKENLAKVFTENRYKKADNLVFSEKLKKTLKEQGF